MIRPHTPGSSPVSSLFWFLLCAGPVLMVVSCASGSHQKAVSLVSYVNEHILNLAPVEAQALERYAEVTGDNYTSDQAVHRALENYVIPLYERFQRSLDRVPIEDPEIGRLHGRYLRSARLLLEGFKAKRLALETNDPRLMDAANEKIERGRKQGEQWRLELARLCRTYGVVEEER